MSRRMPSHRNFACLGSGLTLASLLLSGSAAAQTAPALADVSVERLDDITVTARKRDEKLLDVPLAVSAFSSARIETLGLRNLADLSSFSPGFYLTPLATDRADRSVVALRFRGMSTESGAPLATLFLDGVTVASGQTPGLDDVERVEVIKGPQSAYFGRATFSGAVNVITKTPGNEWGGHAKAEVGSYGLHDVSLSLEGPLIKDKLSIRVTGRDFSTDGQYKNGSSLTSTAAGTTYSDRLGAQSTRSLAVSIYATPIDGLRIRGRFDTWRDKDGAPASVQLDQTKFNCSFGQKYNYYCGEVTLQSLGKIGYDTAISPTVRAGLLNNGQKFLTPFNTSETDKFGLERHAYAASLSADYDVTDAITFSAIGAYHQSKYTAITGTGRDPADYPANPYFGIIPGAPQQQIWDIRIDNLNRDYSFEARLASTGTSPFHWLLGSSYLNERSVGALSYFSSYGFTQFADGTPTVTNPQTIGMFGSLGYDIFHNLTVSVEGRYQWTLARTTPTLTTGALGKTLEATYKKFLPRVIINYKPVDTINLYANYAKGNRPAAFNASISALTAAQQQEVLRQTGAQVAIPEETLTDFEGGVKAELFGGRAQFSLGAYKMIWRNQNSSATAVLQTPGTTAGITQVQVTTSVGKSDLWGIEFEGSMRVARGLTFSGTFDLANSEIKSFNCVYCVSIIGTNNVDGNRIPRTPKYSGSFSADYTTPAFEDYDMFLHGDFTYQGKKYESELNLAYTGVVTKVNLRAGIQNKKIRIEAYVKNLLNNEAIENINRYAADLLDLSNNFGHSTIAVALPEKRTIGLRAGYTF